MRLKVELPPKAAIVPPPVVAEPQIAPTPAFGFSFNAPVAQTTARRGKATSYPIAPDPDGTLAQYAAKYKLAKEKFEAADAEMEQVRPRIIAGTFPFWCQYNSGKAEHTHVSVQSPEGEIITVYQDRYLAASSAAEVQAIAGPDVLQTYFKPSFVIKIKSDALPESSVTQTLLNELIALFTKHGQAGALEFKQSVIPRKGWADIRHRVLSPEQNVQLNAVCPIVVQLKTKGRGGD